MPVSQVSPAPAASPGTPGSPDTPTASGAPNPLGAEGGGRPQERDAFFDNAKFLAIVLVVVGHSWEGLRDGSRVVAAGYLLLYAFHMPAFTIVSGHFSRSFSFRPRQIRRLVTGVVVPYVVFETALNLFRAWNTGEELRITLLYPWYLTWFLMALFIWRLTAPLWRALRHPFTVSVVLAAFATASPDIGGDLALQRVLQYLPFFVLGLRLERRHFEALRGRRMRLLAPAVLALGALAAYWAVPRMNPDWFYHRYAAQELGAPGWVGVLMTLGMLGCSLLLSAAFLSLTPSRHTWFTALGAGTLYAYLLHGFLAKGAHYWGWYEGGFVNSPAGFLLVTAAAAAVAVALTTPPVVRAFRWVMEPRLEWFFAPERPSQAERERRTAPPGA
ncbi:acyltransferase family protein [Streptomyces verrucosisporus]|uniref:acyltransferase family protein n=1 Tax=Streptomyces verrucosisporus TaxID=1695161 RepID=UPI0019D0E814|nr:acyltransferase family protein [Streptomyces verrucosisporus]